MNDVTNKRVLVTGGAKGLGAAIVETLVQQGFDVDFMSKHDGAFDGTGVSVCIMRITRK